MGRKTTWKIYPEEVDVLGNELIENINKKKAIEEEKQVEYEKEIQVEVDKARYFAKNIHLSGDQAEEMLKRLKDYREYGNSSTPAKYRAFVNKGKGVLNELITISRVRIHGEEIIQGIKEFLDQSPKLLPDHLGGEYRNFENKIREINNEKEMNDFENRLLHRGTSLRVIRSRLHGLFDQADKLLAQRADYDIWVLAFELEKSRNSSESTDEETWLMYISRKTKIDNLIDPRRGELLKKIRGKASANFTELLKSCGVEVDQKATKEIIASCQEKINRANLEEFECKNMNMNSCLKFCPSLKLEPKFRPKPKPELFNQPLFPRANKQLKNNAKLHEWNT